MTQDELAAHLGFFAELGVTGVRREPEWRARTDAAGPAGPAGVTFFQSAIEDDALEGRDATDEDGAAPVRLLPPSREALDAVRADIGEQCSRCKLHALGRTRIVFGVGSPEAKLMFVGEAPGADEDLQGEPFVGRAGQLLTRIIEAIGLTRQDVYIANVIKCRPPGNRNPEPDEVEQCEPFLFRQIDAIKPKVIVALGKFAAQSLLRTTEPITRLRGREYAYRDAILMPTYHPAYLLRNPSAKREVWEDMKRVRTILAAAT
jgi:DNA polymerase